MKQAKMIRNKEAQAQGWETTKYFSIFLVFTSYSIHNENIIQASSHPCLPPSYL